MVVEGGLYHVYNRFARGAALFDEGDESERFVELLRRVRDRDGLAIFAYCLMRTGARPEDRCQAQRNRECARLRVS